MISLGELIEYIKYNFIYIPDVVYIAILTFIGIGMSVIFYQKGIMKGLNNIAALFLYGYIALIICSTVIYRSERTVRNYDCHPFWSYIAIANGNHNLLLENSMNFLVFIPIGISLGLGFKYMPLGKVLLIGAGTSIYIEIMQFFLKRGFAEFDDVFHNTLGCLLGFFIYKVSTCLSQR